MRATRGKSSSSVCAVRAIDTGGDEPDGSGSVAVVSVHGWAVKRPINRTMEIW